MERSSLLKFGMIVVMLGVVLVLVKKINDPTFDDVPPPTTLHPIVEKYRNTLVDQAENIGISILITDELRTFDEQEALYAKGRTKPGNIVTYAEAGESYHNYGLAIDFALLLDDGRVIWDLDYDGNENGKSDWMEVVTIAKELGFEWGGDWKRIPDYPHLQMSFGLSIWELKLGKRPNVKESEGKDSKV